MGGGASGSYEGVADMGVLSMHMWQQLRYGHGHVTIILDSRGVGYQSQQRGMACSSHEQHNKNMTTHVNALITSMRIAEKFKPTLLLYAVGTYPWPCSKLIPKLLATLGYQAHSAVRVLCAVYLTLGG